METLPGAERILTVWGQDVENPTSQFGPRSKILDTQLPSDSATRVVYWQGLVWTAGPLRAQLEVWLGATWDRANVALPEPGWYGVAGCFEHGAGDPRRIVLRVRSYDQGADAKAMGFRLDAVDVSGVTYGSAWLLDTGTGSNTKTTQQLGLGERREVATVGLSGIPAGLYRVAATCDVQPQGRAALELWEDGHQSKTMEVGSDGIADHYPAQAFQTTDLVEAGSRSWSLKVLGSSAAPTRIRRPGLFVVNWDEVMA